jgi:hypothetical protein
MRQPIIGRVVVHYDLYFQYSQDNGFGYLEELMYKSDKLVVLTIKVEKKLLIKRTNLKVLRAIFGLVVRKKVARVTRLKRIRRMLKMKKLYKRGFSKFLYERWFNYLLHSNIATHWLINPNDSDVIIAYPYMEDKVF